MKKSVFITGIKGFIGKNLIKEFKKKNLILIKKNLNVLKRGETIIHLASRTGVPQSWEEPENFLKMNNNLLLEILENCRKKKLNLIFLSTVYQDCNLKKINKDSKIYPTNPYALSKNLSENICRFFSKEFNLNITIIRLPIIFGSGQNDNFFIPKIISKLKVNKSINIYGSTVFRNYIFIDDLISIIEKIILNQKKKFKIYNLSNKHNYFSNLKVVKLLLRYSNSKSKIYKKKKRLNESNNLKINSSDIHKDFKWSPKTNLLNGIEKIFNASTTK